MSASEIVKMVDHAAAMNDRWLFLAAFCLLLVLCGLVIHWLVQHLQGLLAENKASHETHRAAMDRMVNTQNETALKLAVCIERNSLALQDNSFELRRFKEAKA